ncbi:hypothetical protein LSH36_703g01033 [Paralvinella palmiformis]|uniref:Uncharacterized protein n=1 Tax=Paralvinella palmiformis TaxID=53620 RepID=A0AAD9MV92_9ANNE|nr:hypothetical protein LSH36_703g01033 [Paralvinella palmiformis]
MKDGLEIYDDKGHQIDHYLSHHCKPVDRRNGWLCGVSVGRNVGNIVVTEWSHTGYLHVYDTAGDSWRYNRCCVCQWPDLVGITSDGFYVVSSYDDRKLYLYTSQGVELWSIDMSRDGGMYDMFVDNNDIIFVCLGNKVVYYKSGKLLSLLSTDTKIEPRGVFVDKNREIFVCDYKNNNILLFDKNYKFIKCLIHLDYKPSKISLYNNKRLSVIRWDDNKVYVYKI